MMSKNARVLAYTSLAHFANDGVFLIYPLLIVYYSVEEKISLVFLGSLAIIYTVLSGILSPFIGDFADKSDRDPELLAGGIGLEALAIVFFSLAFLDRTLAAPLITVGVVLLGSGQAFYHPLGGAMLSRTFGRGAGRALGLNGAMGSVGRSVMPSVISLLLLYLGDVLGLTTFFAYMAVVSVLIYFGVKDLRRGGQQQVRKTTEKLERGFYKFLLILGALVFLRSMFITGTATFLGEFEYQIYLSKTLAGIFLTVGFAGSIVGQPVFGWLTERLGGRTSFALSSVMSVLFFALFLLSVRNLYLSATAYTLFTFAAYTGFPVLLGYVSQVFPKSFFTVANSYIWGVGNTIGGAAGTALVTALLGLHFTILEAFYLLFALALVSTVLTPLIPKRV